MVDDFQNILFTSLKKRVQLSEEQNKKKTGKNAKNEEYKLVVIKGKIKKMKFLRKYLIMILILKEQGL